ncbi:spore germination protein [Paenibacillus thalictri]|uniref:Uncharacterized protein n=1 Tax=Paenibacillus thalictri TaxID=2527873 RepID=A0A4Q9DVR1_9BACL|nr:spore germination protein [Paenibacillus thalictri]TBL79081.1 hypothetical protein EYB31_12725 [Paenibacillus thalictri]
MRIFLQSKLLPLFAKMVKVVAQINVFGSLIISKAATQTGLMSKMMMIVTAISVIGTYLPNFQMSYTFRLWKYPFIAAAAVLGLYEIVLMIFVLLSHLCTKQSFGIPYLGTITPFRIRNFQNRKSGY